jgi:hypothetical protein
MARPPLPIGSWGRISSRVLEIDENGKPVKVRAKANFRDHDGHVRDVTAYGKTATAAESALLKKLQDRAKTGQSGELTAMHNSPTSSTSGKRSSRNRSPTVDALQQAFEDPDLP